MPAMDYRDVPISDSNSDALDGFERALAGFNSYFGNPLAEIDAVLAAHPDFAMAHCLRAGMLLTATEKGALPLALASVKAVESVWKRANDRERRHALAARAWIGGEVERAVALYGRLAIDYPRDLVALQIAHLGDFCLGHSGLLRDRIARALPGWSRDVPGYGYVLGMHAFGLEETGLYEKAEERGRRALEHGRRDPWAIHAVAHVMEMQGRVAEGVDWLMSREPDWAPDNAFAFHNWWHLALYHLDIGDVHAVLELYDRRIRPQPSTVVLELIDATAMLWRLLLRGVDAGHRWADLANSWEQLAEDGHYAFNDVHAMMAYVAARRGAAAARLFTALGRRADGGGTNAGMTRDVGLPLCRALQAFGREEYGTAARILVDVLPVAHRFGGSHAQRDIVSLTAIESALRGGDAPLARALAAERVDRKARSRSNARLMARALDLPGNPRPAVAATRPQQARSPELAGS